MYIPATASIDETDTDRLVNEVVDVISEGEVQYFQFDASRHWHDPACVFWPADEGRRSDRGHLQAGRPERQHRVLDDRWKRSGAGARPGPSTSIAGASASGKPSNWPKACARYGPWRRRRTRTLTVSYAGILYSSGPAAGPRVSAYAVLLRTTTSTPASGQCGRTFADGGIPIELMEHHAVIGATQQETCCSTGPTQASMDNWPTARPSAPTRYLADPDGVSSYAVDTWVNLRAAATTRYSGSLAIRTTWSAIQGNAVQMLGAFRYRGVAFAPNRNPPLAASGRPRPLHGGGGLHGSPERFATPAFVRTSSTPVERLLRRRPDRDDLTVSATPHRNLLYRRQQQSTSGPTSFADLNWVASPRAARRGSPTRPRR